MSQGKFSTVDENRGSVLPPIQAISRQGLQKLDELSSAKDHESRFLSPQVKRSSKQFESLTHENKSSTRSIYKLDQNMLTPRNPRHPYNATLGNSKNQNMDKIFANMNIQDKSDILDRIHKMRLKAIEKKDGSQEPK
jgi:hypothetical protein